MALVTTLQPSINRYDDMIKNIKEDNDIKLEQLKSEYDFKFEISNDLIERTKGRIKEEREIREYEINNVKRLIYENELKNKIDYLKHIIGLRIVSIMSIIFITCYGIKSECNYISIVIMIISLIASIINFTKEIGIYAANRRELKQWKEEENSYQQ